MARATQDKGYRTFVNGFITEATGLTFPENSCRDIDNCDIELKGTVRRRLGLNEEPGGYSMAVGDLDNTTNSGSVLSGPYSRLPTASESCAREEIAVTAHPWPQPGGAANLNFIVFQIGNRIFVQDWDADAVSDPAAIAEHVTGPTSFLVDDPSTGFVYNTSHIEAAKVPMQSTPGFGHLWMTSTALIPFYLEYDTATETIAIHPVGFDAADASAQFGRLSIRDFNGVSDGLAIDNQPATLSTLHRYNLLNQGWTSTQYNDYFAGQGKYPSNSQQWILGKDSSDVFDDALLVKQDFGNSPAPKGRGVLHALLGDRDSVFSGVSFADAQDEKSDTSFASCAFFAGRVWFSGERNQKRPNGVYFSKTLQKITDAGTLMQENDPTSEHFSDLVATDGGVIYITEAATILRLIPFGAGLLVMATNGIWFIYGGEGGFTATNFSTEKVSATGIIGASTVAATDQQVVFFAENSVHVVALPERGVIPAVIDIAEAKIFSYYGLINRSARARANACYDSISKKVFWSWQDVDPESQTGLYDRMLILDSRTGAFTKYSFVSGEVGYFGNGVVFPKRSITRPQTLETVVTVTDGTVTHSVSGDVVAFVDGVDEDEFLNSIKVVILDGVVEGLHIGEFYDTNFRDYRTMTSYTPQDFVSYVITGDEIAGDMQRNKQATFLHNFFNRTEIGFEIDTAGQLIAKRPSGCTVVARWDWHNTAAGGRWSDAQRAYRYRRPYNPVDVNDTFDTGEEIVYTKLKIRGKGRALTLRYESESQKDFQLLGYSVAFTANGV